MAGRVLMRFLRTAVDANQRDTIMLLQSQISFVRSVLNKAGERVPLACASYVYRRHSHHIDSIYDSADRYGKMLNDTLVNMCGENFSDPLPESLPPRGHFMPGADVHPGVPIIEQLIV